MNDSLQQDVLAYMKQHNTMTLATVGADGPWAADLFYVNDGFTLYWLSDPDTRHSQNIANDSAAAATIHEEYADWRVIQGIQLEGIAEQVGTGTEAAHPLELYVRKYPFLGDVHDPTSPLSKALATAEVYQLTPTRLYFIDNTKGLGHRTQVELSEI